jgi:hypothetical protein
VRCNTCAVYRRNCNAHGAVVTTRLITINSCITDEALGPFWLHGIKLLHFGRPVGPCNLTSLEDLHNYRGASWIGRQAFFAIRKQFPFAFLIIVISVNSNSNVCLFYTCHLLFCSCSHSKTHVLLSMSSACPFANTQYYQELCEDQASLESQNLYV